MTPLSRRAPWYRAHNWPYLLGGLGAAGLGVLLLLALAPDQFAPYDPSDLVGRPFAVPSVSFPLGTNDIGQDLLSELIWGTRASLTVGLTVGATATLIGTMVGLVSGFREDWVSRVLMRLVDLTLALPFLPLIILLSAYLGPNQRNIIIILALVSWAGPARLIRAQVLETLSAPYLEAARAIGSSEARILWKHLWPAVRPLAIVQVVLVSGSSILAEASLSFLGLGDPATKSWGTTLYFAQVNGVFLTPAWRWWVLPAGLLITAAVLSLVTLSFALERRFEPRI